MYLQSKIIPLHLGLEQPIRILHLTDIHLSLADSEDSEAQNEWATRRRTVFFNEAKAPQRDPVSYFEESMAYSEEFDGTVITGDVLDGLGHSNLEEARRILKDKDYLFCVGNHEFCAMRSDAEKERRADVIKELKTVFRGNLSLEGRVVGGVNLVVADNSACYFTKEQFDRLKQEVAKGYPILLFTHCPLEDRMRPLDPEVHGKRIESGIATEEEIAVTYEMVEYIAQEPLIKATFGGHWHLDTELALGDKTTYVLAGLFKGIVGEIHID